MSTTTSAINSAPIIFSGLASGLDTSSIVTKLMALNQQPLTNLQNKKTATNNALKAYNSFHTLLTTFQSSVSAMNLTSKVRTTTASVSTGSPFTATSNNAFTGSYSISVNQLAQVQKNISSGFSSNNGNELGSGTITINDQIINIDSSNNSLQGAMSAINAVSSTTGVSATIINDGNSTNSYHLILTGQDASKTFTVASDLQNDQGDEIPLTTSTVQTAQQANITIDGINIVSNSNTVTGAIAGVTLNLNAVSATINSSDAPTQYATSQLTVASDTSALEENINTFVTNYNAIINWVNDGYALASKAGSSSANPSTAAEPTDAQLSQIMIGDSSINAIKKQLQSILSGSMNPNGTSGLLSNLSSIGISTNSDGTLSVKTSTLQDALQKNFSGVTTLLAGDGSPNSQGVMGKFNTYLLKITSLTQGMYAQKQTTSRTVLRNLDNQISRKSAALAKMETSMRMRFNAMERLISNLNSQSSYIMTLNNLAGLTNSSNSYGK
ncbi:MAG: flagellar filament capping protein FliD [Desulfocapsaceae bacterium]|nr:flagellar filament capping protein FliD [Desulfocapsaceae bacterium]